MKTVIVPTDYDPKTKFAVAYATEYARVMQCKLVLFYAYSNKESAENKAQYQAINTHQFSADFEGNRPVIVKRMQERFDKLHSVEYVCQEGNLIPLLNQYTEERGDVEVVVIDSVDRLTWIESFVQGDAVRMMNRIEAPIISVPDSFEFDGVLDNILFLTGFQDSEIPYLERLITQSQAFKSKLHIVHFDQSHTECINPEMDPFKEKLEEYQFDNVEFVAVDSIDVLDSVRTYCENYQIDLVCVLNKRMEFYQRVFNQSLAETLVNDASTPVMALTYS